MSTNVAGFGPWDECIPGGRNWLQITAAEISKAPAPGGNGIHAQLRRGCCLWGSAVKFKLCQSAEHASLFSAQSCLFDYRTIKRHLNLPASKKQ